MLAEVSAPEERTSAAKGWAGEYASVGAGAGAAKVHPGSNDVSSRLTNRAPPPLLLMAMK